MKSGKHVKHITRLEYSKACNAQKSFFKPVESKVKFIEATVGSNMSIPKPTQQEQFPKQNTSNGSMDAFVCKEDVTKTEILWTLKLITTH